jgi:hypothetical protein
MNPSTRRTLLVAVIGLIVLGLGVCAFVERSSYVQDAAAEGLGQEAP